MGQIMEQAASTEETVLGLVDKMLGVEGLAVQAGYRHSDQQLDFSRRAAMVLCRYDNEQHKTSIGMLEAATGLGKTLGYLVALFAYAATTGERCAVSTHSRQLQRQMLGKDAVAVQGWVRHLTGLTMNVARRMGKQNYVSQEKVNALLQMLPKGKSTSDKLAYSQIHDFLTRLSEWMPTGSGVLDDFVQDYGLDLPDGLTPRQLTLDQHANDDDAAHYRRDTTISKVADIVIINHSLLVLHAYRWGTILDEQSDEGRTLRAIVVDEAHKLPEIAETVLSDSLSLLRFNQISKKIVESHPDNGNWEALASKTEVIRQFLSDYHNNVDGRYASARHIPGLEGHLETLAYYAIQSSKGLLNKINSSTGSIPRDQLDIYGEALDHCNDAMRIYRALNHPTSGTPIISWSPIKEYPSLSIGAPDAGETLSRLWAPLSNSEEPLDDESLLPPRPLLNSIVFTSATLGAPGDPLPQAFDALSRRIGINRHIGKSGLPVHNVQTDLMVRHAPQKFGKMSFVLPDPGLPSPSVRLHRNNVVVIESNPTWMAYTAEMLKEAASTGERVLVLTLSWRDTELLTAALTKVAPSLNVIAHQRGEPLRAMLAHFEADDDAVLITPAGWEGVDAPGLVKNLMIHRIPFAPPNTDVEFRMRLHLRDLGYSADHVDKILHKRAQESVRQTLAQGLGRGIRAYDDVCRVWIGDPRFPLPQEWRSSFDEELEKRMGIISGRFYNRRLLEAIPARFRESFDQALIWLIDHRLYQPEEF